MGLLGAAGEQSQFTWRNFAICFLVCMCQMAFGYPASIIGTTLGEPSFLVYMGLLDAKTEEVTASANQLIGAMSGVFQAGALFGILGSAYVTDRWGRKAGVKFVAAFSLFGGALLCASQNVTMFIVARFFAGAGSWGYLAVTPTYSVELAPPALRGLFVGMNGVNIGLGYAFATYMGMAFYYAPYGEVQWRAPLGIALLFPIISLIIIYLPMVPESPRWLLMKGRNDEARDVIMKLHAIPGDTDSEFARSELYQMTKQAEFDRTLDPSWWQMFSKPSYRKRTLFAIGTAFVGQSTGDLVLNNYGPTIYKSLGFNTEDQLRFQCGWITVGVVFNVVGALCMDRFGRKPFLIIGVCGAGGSLIVEAAMVACFGEAATNLAGLRTGVAATYIFLAFYCVGIDVAGVVFYSELFPNHLRAKGICIAVATVALTDLVYLQATATAFANIGWKFYLLFICLCACGATWIFFFVPETKGVPLEEMAKLFGDTDDIMVYAEDVHVDHNTHELVVEAHEGKSGLTRVATEAGHAGHALHDGGEKYHAETVEQVV